VQRWKKVFPDLAAKVDRIFGAQGTYAAEVEWSGTQRGPLETPFGLIPPTNKRGTVKGMLMFKVQDGKIIESRNYFDFLTVLVSLGVTPMLNLPAKQAGGEPITRRH
jgi:predicted ester cyclase